MAENTESTGGTEEAKGAAGAEGGAAEGAGKGERTFTQAEVDKMLGSRADRDRKVAERFGVASLEDLDTIVNSHREQQDAAKTEADKLREAHAAAEQRAVKAEAEAAAAKRERAYEAALRKAGAAEDRLSAAFRLTDFPDDLAEDGYDKLAAATLAANPFLAGQEQTIPGTRGAAGRGGAGDASKAQAIAVHEQLLGLRPRRPAPNGV